MRARSCDEVASNLRAVDADALVERTATAVPAGFSASDVGTAAGLLLDTYYDGDALQVAPLAGEFTEVHEHVKRDGYEREIDPSEIKNDPATLALCEALNERIGGDDDGTCCSTSTGWRSPGASTRGSTSQCLRMSGDADRRAVPPPAQTAARQAIRSRASTCSCRCGSTPVASPPCFAKTGIRTVSVATPPGGSRGRSVGRRGQHRPADPRPECCPGRAVAVRAHARTGAWHDAIVDHGAWLSCCRSGAASTTRP